MRWKNRQIKLYVNIPKSYQEDEDFAQDLAEVLDSNFWNVTVMKKGIRQSIEVTKAVVGEIEIEPEGKD